MRSGPSSDLALLDATSGDLVRLLPRTVARLGPTSLRYYVVPRVVRVIDDVIVVNEGDGQRGVPRRVVANSTTDEPRWARATHSRASVVPLDAGDALVLLPDQHAPGAALLERLDPATGATRWSAAFAPGPRALAPSHGSSVHVFTWANSDAAEATIHALDPATGTTRWRVPLPVRCCATPQLDGDALGVLVGASSGVWHLAADSGATRWYAARSHAPGTRTAVALFPRVAVVMRAGGAVAGLDRTSGDVVWERREGDFGELQRFGALLLAADDRGELHALDPASGSSIVRHAGVRWNQDEHPLLHAPGADPELFASVHASTVAFGRDATPHAAPTLAVRGRVRVNGHPARGVEVRLGAARARTDRAGRYRIESTVAGTLWFSVDGGALTRVVEGHPCVIAAQTDWHFDNDGSAREHDVELDVAARRVERCGACDCE